MTIADLDLVGLAARCAVWFARLFPDSKATSTTFEWRWDPAAEEQLYLILVGAK